MQKIAVEKTRLGIPLLAGFDVLHGHKTIFPIPLAEAASFDPRLWEASARAAAIEAAADGISMTFAPMLDIARDPRWGRIAEGAGEDPWVGDTIRQSQGARLPRRWLAGRLGKRRSRCRHGQAFLRLWRGPCRTRLCFSGCFRTAFARSLFAPLRGGGGGWLRRDHAGLQRYRRHSDDRPYSLAARLAAPRGWVRRRDRQRL